MISLHRCSYPTDSSKHHVPNDKAALTCEDPYALNPERLGHFLLKKKKKKVQSQYPTRETAVRDELGAWDLLPYCRYVLGKSHGHSLRVCNTS